LKIFTILKAINKILISMGIDLKSFFLKARLLPSYINDFIVFKKYSHASVIFDPIFEDNESSANLGEYFWQDLYVAKKIINSRPHIHYDIGSRIDGFISILSTHLQVEVFDIRPSKIVIENINFNQLDIVNISPKIYGVAKSLSCLHTLEHIGLGRYGDQTGINDWIIALTNLKKILTKGGILYLSTPIGAELIRFNSNRIFSPKLLHSKAIEIGLRLVSFSYVTFVNNIPQKIEESFDIYQDFERIEKMPYSLGIFVFQA